MANFTPESILLNHVYIPFYQAPIKVLFNCKQHFSNLELGSNGFYSVIDLTLHTNDERVFPFIDLRKFDIDTKSWYWYDNYGFPYSVSSVNGKLLTLVPSWWDINDYGSQGTISIDPNELEYEDSGKGLGFYSSCAISPDNNIKLYSGSPIAITVGGKPLLDKTIYGHSMTEEMLTNINPRTNMEFYYDSDTNRIHTNQNLKEFDPKTIEVYFFTVEKSIAVKCRMQANQGKDTYLTPIVDYYVVKLNGQYLKG